MRWLGSVLWQFAARLSLCVCGPVPQRLDLGLHHLHARRSRLTLALASLLAIGLAGSAHAQTQSIGVGKSLCVGVHLSPDPNQCPSTTTNPLPVGNTVFYTVTLQANSTTPSPVIIQESYPTDFTPQGVQCFQQSGSQYVLINNATTSANFASITVPMPPSATVVCVISGHFMTPGASADNSVNVTNVGGTTLNTAQVHATVPQNPPLLSDLSATKTASATWIDVSAGPATVHFTITVTNNSAAPVFAGGILQLEDDLTLIPGSVPLTATYVPGSAQCQPPLGPNCFGAPTVSPTLLLGTSLPWQQLLSWTLPAGAQIPPNGTITVGYDVEIDRLPQYNCINTGDGVRNQAVIKLGTATNAISDPNPANNTGESPLITVFTGQTIQNSNCAGTPNAPPALSVTKTLDPSTTTPVQWPGSAIYDITITNTSSNPVPLSSFRDFIREDPGTPLFKATATPLGCQASSGPPPYQGTGGTQQLQGYYSTLPVWNDPQLTVPAHGSITCKIKVTFSDQTCDSWDAGLPSQVTNIAEVQYQDTVQINNVPTQVIYTLSAVVATPMAQAGVCQFEVKKGAQPNKVTFGTPITYTVKFFNNQPGPAPTVVGTLGDFLSIVQPNYATSMPVNYSYTCVQTGGVTGFSPTGGGPGQVSYATPPTQGVQLMLQHYVTFPPNSELTCTITVTVQRPPVGDPYCMSAQTPQLRNVAVMDISPFFNPNLPWPPTQPANGQPNWAEVTLPLPKCMHLQVNKSANPTTTTTTGGPVTYTVTIQNLGDDLIATPPMPAYPWVLHDVFAGTYTSTTPTITGCASPDCTVLSSGNPFALGFQKFLKGSVVTVTFTLNPPFPAGQICNDASASMDVVKTIAADWYANNYTDPVTTPKPPIHLCVPVTEMTSLQASKKTQYLAGVPIPQPAPVFPLLVQCTPGPTAQLFLSDPASTVVPPVNTIPVGASCLLTEGAATLPANYPPNCHWVPTFVVDGVPHTGNPITIANIPAQPNPHLVQVVNNLVCPPTTSLLLTKKADDMKFGGITLPPPPFTVNVNCTGSGTGTNYTLISGAPPGPPQVTNIPVGSNCTINETPPPVPSNFPYDCRWVPLLVVDGVQHVNPFTITNIQAQPNPHTILVTNKFDCTKLTSLTLFKTVSAAAGASLPATLPPFPVHVTCTPGGPTNALVTLSATGSPQYVNGITASPGVSCKITETVPVVPPNVQNCQWTATVIWNGQSHPNASTITGVSFTPPNIEVHNEYKCSGPPPGTPTAPGCGPGMVKRGKDCVRPIACTAPLIPNAAGIACTCPDGTVQKGRDCVKPINCVAPMVPSAAGTACSCPQGTVPKGRDCVRQIDCRAPMIANPAGTACTCPQGTQQKGQDCVVPGRPDVHDPRGNPRAPIR